MRSVHVLDGCVKEAPPVSRCVRSLFGDERCHIDHLQELIGCEGAEGLASESELNGATVELPPIGL